MDRRPPSATGAVAVEFALLLPVLLLMLGGIFGLGRALAQFETLTKATRDGARLFSVQKKATINSAAIQLAKDRVVAMAKAGGMPAFSSSNVLVTCLAKSTYADSTCVDGTEPGGVRVETTGWTYTMGSTVPLINYANWDITMKASTTMRYMNPNP